ncbi:hypothetical protein Hanom_Chr12g01095531 [Helianthus anomalus]
MENPDENNSDCELVSENEVVSKKKQIPKKDGKPPCLPPTVSDTPKSVYMKDLTLEQPTIIIDETVHKGWISDVYKRLWLILSFLLFKCSRTLWDLCLF